MNCNQCPVGCGADRSVTAGACGVKGVRIAKYGLHNYEEPPISYKNGSGCIFFCGCTLKCVFCQNFGLSRNMRGKDISVNELADVFKRLEDAGAENINLVNPTHYLSHIAEAIAVYRPKIPVVYNTHGYETVESLRVADKFVDVWLTDLKFIDDSLSRRYTSRGDYSDYALSAVRFMSQKPLIFKDGKILSGCIVRHLMLPQAVYDSVNVVKFVASLEDKVCFSLMSQYTPFGEIEKYPELKRRITHREYDRVEAAVRSSGLKNVYLQGFESAEELYIPRWEF